MNDPEFEPEVLLDLDVEEPEADVVPDAVEEPQEAHLPRLRPSDAAKAWLARQEASKRRKSVTIAKPEEAIAIYRTVRLGGASSSQPPSPLGSRAEMDGSPIPLQVWAFVRATPGYERWRLGVLGDAGFEAEIDASWDLPKTFHAPLPALCGFEIEQLARGRSEINLALQQKVDREARGDEEGRLRPGVARS